LSHPISENISHIDPPGSSVSKFAGLNVQKRLITEEAYKNEEYEEALKKAFLGTDEDFF
jgi:protein phosphatase 2C family protein 2/3